MKFNDADLLGLPVRLVVSPRNLRSGAVEVKGRGDSDASMAAMDNVVDRVRGMLEAP